MTSKEMVVQYLKKFKVGGRNYGKTFECEMFNSILKDLDRLEELKKVINKEYIHWKRIKYNDEMNGHSNNTADYYIEFLSLLKEVLCNE